ncbi:hypothetical protein SAMN05444506_1292 [Pseudomonas syringae]|nr:hypothetical protein SAMN05444506_1292 [Pseudomonas syringae]
MVSHSSVDSTFIIKVNVYHPPPFRRHVETPLNSLIGPPIEPHEEIFIREDLAPLDR